ncbi:MAG: hypothetical protein R3D98_02460 [Candidatus Krumholzibacteriia bacterium]
MRTRRRLASLVAVGLLGWLVAAGCGEKITIPQAQGLYALATYLPAGTYPVDDLRDLEVAQGNVFVLTGTGLYKRNQVFAGLDSVQGFVDATALCVSAGDSLVFVWDQGTGQVSWYLTRDLSIPGGGPPSTELPAVRRCVRMATSPAGIAQVPGALTYLYLSDPDSGVVHRYAYDPLAGLRARGILCRSDGEGTRFVKVPAGLARDVADSLLVCDRDSLRNWVIRFNSSPDLTDVAISGPDPLRGRAALFDQATCNPPAAADYVLGDAAACGQSDWVGGLSSANGEFALPADVAVDGSGRIYVADQGNNRVQIFTALGEYQVAYGDSSRTPWPSALAVSDEAFDVGPDGIDYGAFLWVIGDGAVRKFISGDHYDHINEQPPPVE